MYSNVVEELLQELDGVLEKIGRVVEDTYRYALFIAWINTALESRGIGKIVVVGEFAVEIYTGATYRTFDIDLVVEGRGAIEVLKSFLERIAVRELRIYIPKIAILASKGIDIVGTIYDKPKPPIAIEIDSYRLYVESIEELVVRYLAGWKFWNSSEDRDKVFALLAAWWDKMDREYVYKRAREENFEDRLREALEVLELADR